MRIIITVVLMISFACSSSREGTDWVEYQQSDNFTLRHPKGWQVKQDDRSGRVTVRGPEGESVHIWPVFVPQQLDESSAGILMATLADEMAPNHAWLAIEQVNQSALRAESQENDETAVASLTWMSNRSGTAGFCYVTLAPNARYRDSQTTFAEILSSFRSKSPARQDSVSHGRRPALLYVKWQDPRENAFTIAAPRGWRVEGGTVRYAGNDVVIGVTLTSADGQINLFLGDPSIPRYQMPNETFRSLGLVEGMSVSPRETISRYVPGGRFAAWYAQNRYGSAISGFSVSQQQDRRDMTQSFNEYVRVMQNYGSRVETHAGEVYFGGQYRGNSVAGYVLAITMSMSSYMMGQVVGNWGVPLIMGFTSPDHRRQEGMAVLAYLLKSFQWDRRWYETQNQVNFDVAMAGLRANAKISEIISKTGNEIADIQMQAWEAGQARTDRSVRSYGNRILETTDIVDPTPDSR